MGLGIAEFPDLKRLSITNAWVSMHGFADVRTCTLGQGVGESEGGSWTRTESPTTFICLTRSCKSGRTTAIATVPTAPLAGQTPYEQLIAKMRPEAHRDDSRDLVARHAD